MRLAPLRLAALALVLASSALLAQSSSLDQPAQPAGPSAQTQDGQPITDTLTYTVDPVTGERVPASDAPIPPPTKAERKAALRARHSMFDDRYHFGILAKIGTAGAGLELGVPVVPHFALRVGGDYIRYTGTYQYDAANVAASLHFGYARASLDYFPWRHRRFHISPLLIAANQTRIQANVSFAQNTTFDFEGETFYSSPADPLHGTGRVDLRKISPGLTVGFGNITHGRGHWSFPVEMGAFYNGQPKLQLDFGGTVCVVGQPTQYACQRVQDQPDFQKSLAAFRARQEHNLSYAKWIPVFNFGVGYRF